MRNHSLRRFPKVYDLTPLYEVSWQGRTWEERQLGQLGGSKKLAFSVEMDHAVEFRWGQLVQRTEKPMVAGVGREPAEIGFQDASIARGDRPQRQQATPSMAKPSAAYDAN